MGPWGGLEYLVGGGCSVHSPMCLHDSEQVSTSELSGIEPSRGWCAFWTLGHTGAEPDKHPGKLPEEVNGLARRGQTDSLNFNLEDHR